jgi:hypothetical protein
VCTVIVSVDLAADVPVLLVGVRDEFSGRPWLPPARHWPDRPELVGGRDLQAGGTWLAVNTVSPAVACVLNGEGRPAARQGRLSRGELPLLLASGGSLGSLLLDHFDPFHVVLADAGTGTVTGTATVTMWSWDGLELVSTTLGQGLHLVVNSGLEPTGEMAARVGYFGPRLLAAPRPFSGGHGGLDGHGSYEGDEGYDGYDGGLGGDSGDEGHRGLAAGQNGWQPWLPLIDGDGLDPEEPRALVLRREVSDGHFWGSSSISLVALGRDGVRLDFSGSPGSGHFDEVPLN